MSVSALVLFYALAALWRVSLDDCDGAALYERLSRCACAPLPPAHELLWSDVGTAACVEVVSHATQGVLPDEDAVRVYSMRRTLSIGLTADAPALCEGSRSCGRTLPRAPENARCIRQRRNVHFRWVRPRPSAVNSKHRGIAECASEPAREKKNGSRGDHTDSSKEAVNKHTKTQTKEKKHQNHVRTTLRLCQHTPCMNTTPPHPVHHSLDKNSPHPNARPHATHCPRPPPCSPLPPATGSWGGRRLERPQAATRPCSCGCAQTHTAAQR